MKLNTAGIELVKSFEGLKLTSYLCPAGVPTIGYGTTRINNRRVTLGTTITMVQAEEYLRADLNVFANGARNLLRVPLNENQFSALVSFAYNVGLSALRRSTLLKIVNSNPNDGRIRLEFLKWNRANGVVLNGLTRRRTAEANLYFNKI
jgi:lysozyme